MRETHFHNDRMSEFTGERLPFSTPRFLEDLWHFEHPEKAISILSDEQLKSLYEYLTNPTGKGMAAHILGQTLEKVTEMVAQERRTRRMNYELSTGEVLPEETETQEMKELPAEPVRPTESLSEDEVLPEDRSF